MRPAAASTPRAPVHGRRSASPSRRRGGAPSAPGYAFRVQGAGFRVQGSGFRVQGSFVGGVLPVPLGMRLGAGKGFW